MGDVGGSSGFEKWSARGDDGDLRRGRLSKLESRQDFGGLAGEAESDEKSVRGDGSWKSWFLDDLKRNSKMTGEPVFDDLSRDTRCPHNRNDNTANLAMIVVGAMEGKFCSSLKILVGDTSEKTLWIVFLEDIEIV